MEEDEVIKTPENIIKADIKKAQSKGLLNNTKIFSNPSGRLRIDDRWISYGLQIDGASDMIGWRTITITPEMVGTKIAQFVAVEIKSAKGKATIEQEAFLWLVNNNGGIGVLVRSADELIERLK